jgi:hypothetical protein
MLHKVWLKEMSFQVTDEQLKQISGYDERQAPITEGTAFDLCTKKWGLKGKPRPKSIPVEPGQFTANQQDAITAAVDKAVTEAVERILADRGKK